MPELCGEPVESAKRREKNKRKICVVEWMFMLLSLAATIYGLCTGGWVYYSVEAFLVTHKVIVLLIVCAIVVALMVASGWTSQKMQDFEESFERAFSDKIYMIVVYCLMLSVYLILAMHPSCDRCSYVLLSFLLGTFGLYTRLVAPNVQILR